MWRLYEIDGSGQMVILEGLEWSGMASRPSRRVGSGRQAFPVDREWSRGPPGEPGVVGRPYRRPGVVKRPSWRSRVVWNGLVAFSMDRKWSEGHSRGMGVVERYFRMVRSGLKALPEGWQ